MRAEYLGEGILCIHEFLSPAECERYLATAEAQGWEEATINTLNGPQMFKAIRNNLRAIVDEPELAAELYEMTMAHLPSEVDGWIVHGLNERFRFYRYEAGHYFKRHRDGSYAKSEIEASRLTFMVYLNDNFQGGSTQFHEIEVVPKTGMALVFPHRLMHQSTTLEAGIKYVLRTDVMYRLI